LSGISNVFRSLSGDGSAAYIPYICAGDPDRDFSVELIKRLCAAGADILELGLPFSDPIADGPAIQRSMQRSLSGGFKVADLFAIISSIRESGIVQPIVVMSYFNPILQIGIEEFCRDLSKAGGDALLVVDLPPEESETLERMAREKELDIIRLIAPSTSDSRLDYLISKSSGFIYVVSVAGITGARDVLPESAISLLRRVTSRSNVPVAIGFGISHPDQVRAAIAAGASAVIEGSKLISLYSENLDKREIALDLVEKHARDMKAATSL